MSAFLGIKSVQNNKWSNLTLIMSLKLNFKNKLLTKLINIPKNIILYK